MLFFHGFIVISKILLKFENLTCYFPEIFTFNSLYTVQSMIIMYMHISNIFICLHRNTKTWIVIGRGIVKEFVNSVYSIYVPKLYIFEIFYCLLICNKKDLFRFMVIFDFYRKHDTKLFVFFYASSLSYFKYSLIMLISELVYIFDNQLGIFWIQSHIIPSK